LTDPEGSRRLRLPDFYDNRHMKVVRLLAQRTGRLYHQEIFLVPISAGACGGAVAEATNRKVTGSIPDGIIENFY
jgi:hypothetical protein